MRLSSAVVIFYEILEEEKIRKSKIFLYDTTVILRN